MPTGLLGSGLFLRVLHIARMIRLRRFAEDQLAAFNVDLLRLVPRSKPFICHDVIRRIVTPPSRVCLRFWQLETEYLLNFRERHLNSLYPAALKVGAERRVFSHLRTPSHLKYTI